MEMITFENFGEIAEGQIVTHVVGHDSNLLAVCPMARAHGNIAAVEWMANFGTQNAYRKVRAFLAQRGVGVDWMAVAA